MAIIVDFVMWWYSVGWVQRLADMKNVVSSWANYFSFNTLLRTLFQPWKQIIAENGSNKSVNTKTSIFVDNLVSRFVGFGVRMSVLVFGILFVLGLMIMRAIYVLLWPIIPIMPILIVVIGALQ